MADQTISQEADRLGGRRARILLILAIFYLGQQLTFFASPMGTRMVDHFKIGAWAVMSAVLLGALVTGGFWLSKPALRAMLNDELSREEGARRDDDPRLQA